MKPVKSGFLVFRNKIEKLMLYPDIDCGIKTLSTLPDLRTGISSGLFDLFFWSFWIFANIHYLNF